MLKPAIAYKDKLDALFAQEIYTDEYYYYTGYAHGNELPKIEARDNYYQWVSLNKNNEIVGYFAYYVDVSTDNVMNFGLYSFSDKNLTLIKDVYNKLEELIKMHHRIEWRVIEGNHVKKGYDRFCKDHNGHCICLHDITKAPNGEYRNEYIYEIIGKHVESEI